MQVDGIIVGQGIAGTVLAHRLQSESQKLIVIDKPYLSRSSAVAAGIWNPVVFKRLSKSWMADEVLPAMIDFYKSCEIKLHEKLITERHIIKTFSEEQETAFWKKKAQTDNPYLDEAVYSNYQLSASDTIPSYSKVKQSGNLHVQAYLESSRYYFQKHDMLLEEEFDYSELHIESSEKIQYKHITAKYIVFCEGYLIHQNPFFKHIPMKPAKGEVLTIKCEGLNLGDDIFNKNFFIMPLGNHLYKVGATYEWQHLSDMPTDKAKQELIKKLTETIHVPFEIIHHEAGVRPSVTDRRPVLGKHYQNSNVLLFNGFGTKAVMLAPYFSKVLSDHFLRNKNLPEIVDLNRFSKL